jgi:PAS domain S-box-containing protein
MPEGTTRRERSPWAYLLAFAVGTAIIAGFTWHQVREERRVALAHWEARASTIAGARARLVTEWLGTGMADARSLAELAWVRSLLAANEPEARRQVTQHIEQLVKTHALEAVWIQDAQGRVLAHAPAATTAAPAGADVRARVEPGRGVGVVLERREGTRRLVSFSAEVPTAGRGAQPARGIVTLQRSAASLFALLAEEGSTTGETLLFGPEGASHAYLSPLRHRRAGWDAAARSLDWLSEAARDAAASGETFAEVTDYREVPVLAATRWIGPAGWGLVFKIDRDEALAEFYRAGRLSGLAAMFLTMALGAVLVGLWRQRQHAALLRQQIGQERALFALKTYADRIVASIPSGLLVLSDDLRVLSANRSFLESFALREADVVGRLLRDVFDTDGLAQRARDVMRSGMPQHDVLFDLRPVAAQPARPVRVTMAGIHVPEEDEARLLMVVQDLSEQERLRAARQASEQRFRDLVQDLDAIVWEADATTLRFTFVSQRAEAILGYPPRRWMEDPDFWQTRFHPDDRDRAMANFREGVNTEFEYRSVAADGTVLWLRDIVRVVRSADGRGPVLRGLTVDLTERRRAEDALRQSEEQLRQAAKMDAIGKLAAGVAHDFNNLLMVISGRTELLLARLKARTQLRQEILLIHKTAERAAALTHRLLAFSRKQVLQPKVLDVNAIVTNMRGMLQRLIGEHIELVTNRYQDLGRVKADQRQIEQVILNLAVNARDAMPDGGTLTIETANVDLPEGSPRREEGMRPGPYVLLAVRDTGVGMDAETQARLFEPFFTTKQAGEGTGLGLSTVYGIVKQSGGHIWVESAPGEGSTFKIFLPRVAEPLDVAEEPEFPPAALGGTETILLVEDSHQVREVVRKMLVMEGYSVLETRDAGEALQLCQQHQGPIHLMLTDVIMPKVSGPELARRVAMLRPETRVVYMSGYTDGAIARHGVLDTDTAFLQKPFTAEALARKIRAVLDEPREERRRYAG